MTEEYKKYYQIMYASLDEIKHLITLVMRIQHMTAITLHIA